MTAVEGAGVLATGDSRGISKVLVEEPYAPAADKVYATARDVIAAPEARAYSRVLLAQALGVAPHATTTA